VAGVEVLRDDLGREDADAGWEASVERVVQIGGRDRGRESEGNYLAKSVDASVGAARALREDVLTYSALDGVGQEPLDGG